MGKILIFLSLALLTVSLWLALWIAIFLQILWGAAFAPRAFSVF